MLSDFQNVNKDSADLDELVALAAFGRGLAAEFELRKIKKPDFVDIQNEAINREINSRVEAQRAERKRYLKSQIDSTRSAQEKRADYQKELDELEAVSS